MPNLHNRYKLAEREISQKILDICYTTYCHVAAVKNEFFLYWGILYHELPNCCFIISVKLTKISTSAT
jgi:hypothetical protein